MDIIDETKVVLQPIHPDWYRRSVQSVSMLRLDLIHPVISGNKWYKLLRNLEHARKQGYSSILTFGGAHSNHLVAAAAAAKAQGLKSIGIVRGRHAAHELTDSLRDCIAAGMQLVFVNREEYAQKNDEKFLGALKRQFGRTFIIPEGGANRPGREGAELIAKFIGKETTDVCAAVGTGTTFCGLRNALPATTRMIGFVPMRGGAYLGDEIRQYLESGRTDNCLLTDKWHFGGFAKHNDELISFMNLFYKEQGIPLDMVYTSKMMYGLQQMILTGFFKKDARIVCVHSGGLQGNRSIQHRLEY